MFSINVYTFAVRQITRGLVSQLGSRYDLLSFLSLADRSRGPDDDPVVFVDEADRDALPLP